MKEIKSENEYEAAIGEIEMFNRKGLGNLSQNETLELARIAKAVAAYEQAELA